MRLRRAVVGSPVTGFSPGRSNSSQYSPEPRFCHAGRSLKLMPPRKSSSFLAEVDSPRSSASACAGIPALPPEQPVAVGVQGVAVGVLGPPAEVIDDQLVRWAAARSGSRTPPAHPSSSENRALASPERIESSLRSFRPKPSSSGPNSRRDLVALREGVGHLEPAAAHQVLGGLEHVVVEPPVEGGLERVDLLGQPGEVPPVQPGDHEHARQHARVQGRLERPHPWVPIRFRSC